MGKKQGLYSFEQANGIYLFSDSLQTIDSIINTMKLKRKECKEYFKKQIEEFYEKKIVASKLSSEGCKLIARVQMYFL